jgi:hypothetical protein
MQYEILLEDFKEVHKSVEELRGSGYSIAEIRKVRWVCRSQTW